MSLNFMGVCKPKLRKELKTLGVGNYIGQENSNRVHLVSTLGKSSFLPSHPGSPETGCQARGEMIFMLSSFAGSCDLQGFLVLGSPAGRDFRVKLFSITNEVQNGGRIDSQVFQ